MPRTNPIASVMALALASLLFVPRPVMAQNTGFAGVVKDTGGSVLPGVTVEASSPALIEKVRTTVTDGQGRYQIVDVRPGLTRSRSACLDSPPSSVKAWQLSASFTATVNAELRVGTIAETIVVSGVVTDRRHPQCRAATCAHRGGPGGAPDCALDADDGRIDSRHDCDRGERPRRSGCRRPIGRTRPTAHPWQPRRRHDDSIGRHAVQFESGGRIHAGLHVESGRGAGCTSTQWAPCRRTR